MLSFLLANLSTIVIAAVLLLVVVLIVLKLVRDRKNGKTSCGCGCENCPSHHMCHK